MDKFTDEELALAVNQALEQGPNEFLVDVGLDYGKIIHFSSSMTDGDSERTVSFCCGFQIATLLMKNRYEDKI